MQALSSGSVRAKSLVLPEGYSAGLFSDFLDIDVVTQGANVGFIMDTQGLQNPITGCDITLYNACLEYANSLLSEKTQSNELIQRVRRFIANNGMLMAGISDCASQFNSYPRSLQRQLAEYGTSYRKIKEEVLKERTLQELNLGTEIKEIAVLLGYSELSGFYRSFKSWFGMTPKKALKEGVF